MLRSDFLLRTDKTLVISGAVLSKADARASPIGDLSGNPRMAAGDEDAVLAVREVAPLGGDSWQASRVTEPNDVVLALDPESIGVFALGASTPIVVN